MANPHNEAYLRAKRERLGHTLHHQGLALDEEMLQAEKLDDQRDRQSGEADGRPETPADG
jgi:3,4-dihydroxy 2-butanone 4-phosphate synthase/GTP cyclohydrolase II